jgi:hypothetical protein
MASSRPRLKEMRILPIKIPRRKLSEKRFSFYLAMKVSMLYKEIEDRI